MNKEVINKLYNNSLSIQALFVLIAFADSDLRLHQFETKTLYLMLSPVNTKMVAKNFNCDVFLPFLNFL